MTDRGIVAIADAVKKAATPQLTMQGIIDGFDALKPKLEALARDGKAVPAASARLRPPLPRPGKVLACIANYWEHAQREARPLNMFLKNSCEHAVIGPGDTIVLPEFTEPWIYMHEAELAIVIKGPAKMVKKENWRSAVFGYTGMIDVSARGDGRRTWKTGSWLGKSFDTFCPLGPCITTADEIPEPNDLRIKFWNNGQLRHDYNTDDMEHRVPELIAFATTVMTLDFGRPHRLRHQSRGAGRAAGRRDRGFRARAHRQDDAHRARSAEAELGARRLYGRRFHQPRGGPPSAEELGRNLLERAAAGLLGEEIGRDPANERKPAEIEEDGAEPEERRDDIRRRAARPRRQRAAMRRRPRRRRRGCGSGKAPTCRD